MNSTNAKLTIVWDSDGTIVHYLPHISVEQYLVPGYFYGIPVHENIIEAINILLKEKNVKQYICTKYPSERAKEDKLRYFKEILPDFSEENILFLHKDSGKEKEDLITEGKRVLVDDYSYNLNSWENAGGVAVKCLNGINGKNHQFKNAISVSMSGKDIAATLLNI